MDGIFLLFVLAGLVVPLLVMSGQRSRRVRAEFAEEAPADQATAVGRTVLKVRGHTLRCGHCSGTEFEESEAQLNTAVATFFNFDWANRTATCFVCRSCGHIEWFVE